MAVRQNWRGHSAQKCSLRIITARFSVNRDPLLQLVDRITIQWNVLGSEDEPFRIKLGVCSAVIALKVLESSSDDEAGNTPSAQAARQEMSDMIQRQADRIQHQADRIAQVRRVHAEVSALHSLEGSPPPYVTPPGSAAYPNAPRVSPMRTLEPESERATYQADGRMLYSRTAPSRRFAFTPVNSLTPPESSTLPTPPPSTSDDNP